MFRCWVLFFRIYGCCITLTKMKSMNLCLSQPAIFLKYSKEGRSTSSHEGIQNAPSDVCYEVVYYQVPSKKQGMCKVCENNFRCRCVKCKANVHDICFEIFRGCQLMFDCRTQDLKMCELGLFNNIFVQLLSSSFGSFSFFPSRRLSITFDIQINLKVKHPWKSLQEACSESCQTSKMEVFE